MQRKHTWLLNNLVLFPCEFAPGDVVFHAKQYGVDVTANPARWAASQLQVAVRAGAVVKLGWARYERAAMARAGDQDLIGVPQLGDVPAALLEDGVGHLLQAGRALSQALDHAAPGSAMAEYLEGCLRTHSEQAGMLKTITEATT